MREKLGSPAEDQRVWNKIHLIDPQRSWGLTEKDEEKF
jgi:hypothetical protein